ncbi:porin family protein [Solitalea sp. MAHUQ-68]|uniref:Porin family protein n=1 Tax=Solitalea agri TaxID=2953739 RepID=A0A9X2JD20_9SPHI|nr:outer membrane beta-barrel protein [Solitalea agri]MCO4292390.1 porin family protein [Solitalea agri]
MKTIKILLSAAFLILISIKTQAQTAQNKYAINAGFGVGTYGFAGNGGVPITASVERSFSPNISAGLNLSYVQTKYDLDIKYTYIVVGARGSYHFNELFKIANPSIDIYGGAGLLYRHYNLKYNGNDEFNGASSSDGEVDIDLHAGMRYMFTDNIGAHAEVGYGISPLQLGVAFKF